MPDKKHTRQVDSGGHAPKTCVSCGRMMTWRKSWAKNWDEVKYCSDACRKQRTHDLDERLEAKITQLLRTRGAGKTICPSEAARAVAGSEDRAIWEPLMEPTRAAARRLVAKGDLDILQGGHVVDGSTAKGPIRLRLR